MIYIILGLVTVLLLTKYKQTFIVLFAISPLLEQFKTFGTTSLFTIVSVIALVFIPFKLQEALKKQKVPFTITLLIYCSSYIFTYFLGADESKLMSLIRLVLTTFIDFYIFFIILEYNYTKYISTFIKAVTIFSLIFSLYGVVETLIGSNPYIDYVTTKGLYVDDSIITEIRFGYKRCQSVFSMHTTLGYVSAMYCVFLLFIKTKTNFFKSNRIYIIICLCAICVILSGARSMIIGFAICLILFIDRKLLKPKYIIPIIALFLICYFAFYDLWSQIYESFADTESVDGSNADMREDQFTIATMFMNRGTFFGNGLLFTFTRVTNLFSNINGAESIWMPTMIDQGIYGIICTIFVYLSAIVYTFRNKYRILSFFVLGNIVCYSLSSIPGTNYFSFLALLVLMNTMRKNPNIK